MEERLASLESSIKDPTSVLNVNCLLVSYPYVLSHPFNCLSSRVNIKISCKRPCTLM